MPRFFIDYIPDDEAVVTGEDGRHIARSLRMKPGEEITLCDCLGNDYLGEVAEIIGDDVRVKILEIRRSFAEPTVRVTLCQGLTKGDKMDNIVQKAVELGVWRIVPVLTERCVSRPDDKSAGKKVQRWQKIALEAAKQSGRGIVPQVAETITFRRAVEEAPGKRILFYEGGGERITALAGPQDQEITIFIGPEGGFAEHEVELIKSFGGRAGTLGPRILRTETAPLAALTAVMLVTDNL